MEDWQEMLVVIIVALLAVTAVLAYVGNQIAGLRDSISDYNGLGGTLGDAGGSGGDSSPVMSPYGIILNGLGT